MGSSRHGKPLVSIHLALEELEERIAPSAATWHAAEIDGHDGPGAAQHEPPAAQAALAAPPAPLVIDGTDHNDTILIHQNKNGSIKITLNGEGRIYAPAEGQEILINAGAGNDIVRADVTVTAGLSIDGGDGDDNIRGGKGDDSILGGLGRDMLYGSGGNDSLDGGAGDDCLDGGAGDDGVVGGDGDDRITTGAGDDFVDAGLGNDVIILGSGNNGAIGGDGNDVLTGGGGDDYLEGDGGDDTLRGSGGCNVLYGGDGNDAIYGGILRDYIDGGPEDDSLYGGGGGDALFGGLGDDRLKGDAGNDAIAGGDGVDAYWGGAGTNAIYCQSGDYIHAGAHDSLTTVDLSTTNAAGGQLGSSLSIQGDAQFVARVECDIETLRSIPIGRAMLTALDDGGRVTGIQQSDQGNFITFDSYEGSFLGDDGSRGDGTAGEINCDPYRIMLGDGSESWQRRPCIVGLYHEMIHAYNASAGTMQPGYYDATVPNLEEQAVGLPMPGGILWDNDGDPATPAAAGNLSDFTENGWRAFLNLPERPRY